MVILLQYSVVARHKERKAGHGTAEYPKKRSGRQLNGYIFLSLFP